jgi:hypothetical protein
MVDVDVSEPFYLSRAFPSSRSRSFSLGPPRAPSSAGPGSSRGPGTLAMTPANGEPAATTRSRQPSPTPSMRTSPTRSTASFAALDSSFASLAQLPDAPEALARRPTLGVRIVSGRGRAGAGSASRGRSRSRGRVRGFAGEGKGKEKEEERNVEGPSGTGGVEGGSASVGITVESAEDVPDDDSIAGDLGGPANGNGAEAVHDMVSPPMYAEFVLSD